jgi:hypothetical protein
MVQSYWSLFIHETEGNLKKESSNVEIFRPELTPGESMEKSFFLSFLLHYVRGLPTRYSPNARPLSGRQTYLCLNYFILL